MSVNKVRTQIYLERNNYEWLKKRSTGTNISISQQIREAIARYVVDESREEEIPVLSETDPIWDLIGAGDSGLGDLSINHDHYLYGIDKQAEDSA